MFCRDRLILDDICVHQQSAPLSARVFHATRKRNLFVTFRHLCRRRFIFQNACFFIICLNVWKKYDTTPTLYKADQKQVLQINLSRSPTPCSPHPTSPQNKTNTHNKTKKTSKRNPSACPPRGSAFWQQRGKETGRCLLYIQGGILRLIALATQTDPSRLSSLRLSVSVSASL